MTVSIIIVNYNVRYFLEQCLYSVERAARGLEAEVIIIDNNSTDNSEAYLRQRFPACIYRTNTENVGFAKACNQGLAEAAGRYILFLNPDTLLAEDSLHNCMRFFEEHPLAGAIGVRMIDGTGAFLKESKRSFPTPLTSLYKLFGLSLLFPSSQAFGRYHLGHLSEHENHEVDVLAGAFMLIPRTVLNQVGSFDEAFFMYGEDVDLSYRIQAAGYKNYYVADTTIIHFKGESTKRGSLNYVRLFYSAMNIFVRKHYGGARARVFRLSIQCAIWLRASLAAGAKALRWIGLPVIDGILILLSFWLAKEFWIGFVRPDIVLPDQLIRLSLPAYAVAYIVTAYYAGLYDKVYRRSNLVRASAIAALVLLAGYALLPENLRFSRAILLFGALLAFAAVGIVRRMLLSAGVLQRPPNQIEQPYILVASSATEYDEVRSLLEQNGLLHHLIGRVALRHPEPGTVTDLSHAPEAIRALNARELIFCAGDLSFSEIVDQTGRLARYTRLRYHAAGSESLVGSDSKDSSGESLSLQEPLMLAQSSHRRTKRAADVLIAMFLLLTLPLHLLLLKNKRQFLSNLLCVFLGRKTWVGYRLPVTSLPPLRPGVLTAGGPHASATGSLPEESLRRADYWYARDYHVSDDIRTLIKYYRWLGL